MHGMPVQAISSRMLAVAVNPQLVTTDFRSYFGDRFRIASICGEKSFILIQSAVKGRCSVLMSLINA